MMNVKRKISDSKNKVKRSYLRTFFICVACFMILASFSTCFAASGPNYAENGSKWFLDQAFWVLMIFMVVSAIKMFIARAWTPMVVVILGGGILGALIKAPTQMADLGGKLLSIIIGG